jgi:hypothetical protein
VKLLAGMVLGVMLSFVVVDLRAQSEAALNTHLTKAIDGLRDATYELGKSTQDFDGHKASALKACKEAEDELAFILRFKEKK